MTAQSLGGFLGETVAGGAHSSSSLEERLNVEEGMANGYALTHRVPVYYAGLAAGSLAVVAIMRNRDVFDALRRRLARDI